MIRSVVLGTGSFAPERVLSNHDLEKMVETSDDWITERTGIQERRIAQADVATSDLACEAGKRALEAAGVATYVIGGADKATELDAKRAIDQACRLAAAF